MPKVTIFGSSVENVGEYALVSCMVAPGFEFDDFKLKSMFPCFHTKAPLKLDIKSNLRGAHQNYSLLFIFGNLDNDHIILVCAH